MVMTQLAETALERLETLLEQIRVFGNFFLKYEANNKNPDLWTVATLRATLSKEITGVNNKIDSCIDNLREDYMFYHNFKPQLNTERSNLKQRTNSIIKNIDKSKPETYTEYLINTGKEIKKYYDDVKYRVGKIRQRIESINESETKQKENK